eukprot:5764260-Prymnesium_polylepis.2
MDGATLFVTADDGMLPLRPGETAAEVLAQRRDLELHSYFSEIEPLTFQTRFVPIDIATTEAWRIDNRGGALSAQEQARLSTLRAQVSAHVSDFAAAGHRSFVRLSTRSPKDAVDKVERLRRKAVELLRTRLAAAAPDDNAKLCALQEVTSELLSVSSAPEAFELLGMSSRCISDIVRMLDYRDALPSWDLHLIVREYRPLPPSAEFRCFVHERRLTAVSQYFCSCYYPELPAQREATLARIATFFAAQCEPRLSLQSYIIDLAVLPDATWIIELNPYAPTTGACLFDWAADE